MNKISVEKIIELKNISNITMITAYDFVSGHIVNNSDAEIILVGDSLGTTTLGHEFTNRAVSYTHLTLPTILLV